MKLKISLALAAVSLCSCIAAHEPPPRAWADASVASTGCPSEIITTSGETTDGPRRTWRATCRGRVYSCAGGVQWLNITNPQCAPLEK
jgi:hypothetical protein